MSATVTEDRRARTRAARTEAILDAAMAIVDDEGLDALTIARLAHALDAAVGAMYRYFPSKDALLIALQTRLIAEYGQDLRLALEAAPDVPLLRLALVACHYQRYFVTQRAQARLLAQTLADPRPLVADDLAAGVVQQVLALLGGVSDIFRTAAARDQLVPGDAGERAIVFWATIQGVAQTHKLARLTPVLRSDRLLVAAFESLVRGWGGTPDGWMTEARRLIGNDTP